jgi:hypothetical protein
VQRNELSELSPLNVRSQTFVMRTGLGRGSPPMLSKLLATAAADASAGSSDANISTVLQAPMPLLAGARAAGVAFFSYRQSGWQLQGAVLESGHTHL